jgi:hypothetical protein
LRYNEIQPMSDWGSQVQILSARPRKIALTCCDLRWVHGARDHFGTNTPTHTPTRVCCPNDHGPRSALEPSTAVRAVSSQVCPYTSPVIAMDECPSRSATALMCTPRSSHATAAECRRAGVHTAPQQHQRPVPGIRTAPDLRQRPVAGVHRGIAAGAATPHHRPPRQTPRHLGQLGRPRPPRRLARAGLIAPKISGGAVGHADPDAGLAPGEQQFVNDLVAVGMTR